MISEAVSTVRTWPVCGRRDILEEAEGSLREETAVAGEGVEAHPGGGIYVQA